MTKKTILGRKKVTKHYLLIDADGLLYPAAFAAASAGLSLESVQDSLITKINNLVDATHKNVAKLDSAFLYLTMKGSPKYRDQFKKVIPYKESRKKSKVTPVFVRELQDALAECFSTIECKPLLGEADDYICAEAHCFLDNGHTSIIAHSDKDLFQIPGLHIPLDYNGTRPAQFIDYQEAAYNKYVQIVMGDAADNIPGLPGYGVVKATSELCFLETEKELFNRSFELYAEVLPKHGYDDDAIIDLYYETANLIHLRKNLEDDCWTPPE